MDPRFTLTGVFESEYAELWDSPEDESVMDGYPLSLDLYLVPGDDLQLHAESRRMFDDVAAVLEIPMIYLRNYDHLLAAYKPGSGTTEFAAPVSVDAAGRKIWLPFAVDRNNLSSELGN